MQTNRFRLGLSIVAVVALTGCEAEEMPDTEPAMETLPPAEAPATPPITAAPSAAAALMVAETAEYGPHLTDAGGRALYLLEADTPGASTCYDACAEVWPPFVAPQGTPTAGDAAVQSDLIGTLQRRDGTMQITYNGHPLYHYSRDPGPGQVTGQDYTDEWGEWYLVTPAGEELEDEPASE